MDTIRTYLDNMFAGVAQTEAASRLKNEILGNMTEKYNELKAQGKSENEAIGIVISEFGNVEELIAELGRNNAAAPVREGVYVSPETATEYVNTGRRTALTTAIGVAFCILSPIILLLSLALNQLGLLGVPSEEDKIAIVGVIAILAFVAVGVMILIIGGSNMSKFDYLKKQSLNVDNRVIMKLNEVQGAFERKNTIVTAVCIMMYILSAVPVIGAALLCPENELDPAASTGAGAVLICVCVLLLIVAIATGVLCYFGGQHECYAVLRQQEEFTVEEKNANPILSAFSGLFWILIVLAFLYMGFYHDLWAICWIIFPIAGAAYGLIAAIVKSVSKSSNNNSNNNGNWNNHNNY